MRVVVTGATGFIGSALTTVLHERGDVVVPLSLRDPAWRDVLREARPEACFHLAWTARGDYLQSPENLECLAASCALVRALEPGTRLVVAGTCAEQAWAKPTLYATCKRSLREVIGHLPIQWTWAQLYWLYGPHEDERRVIPTVVRAALQGVPARLSAGTHRRDYLYVDDAARALASLGPGVHEVGSGDAIAVRDLAMRAAAAAGRSDMIEFGAITDDIPEVRAASSCLATLGLAPTTLDEGLRRTVAWWRERARSG